MFSAVLGYLSIGVVLLLLWMVAFNKLPEKWYGVGIWAVSLALMWSASMAGAHIIGSDMAGEYYTATQVLGNGGWNPMTDYGTQSSTSWVVGGLVPLLAWVLHVGPEWVFKIVLPLVFSAVPVLLFLAFRRQFGSRMALYSALFFMIVPVTTLEVVQIGKSMVAEVFLALAVYLTTVKLKWYWQAGALAGCAVMALWSHYTVGLALLVYLFGIMLVRVWVAWWQNKSVKVLPVGALALAIVVAGAFGYTYFSRADGGSIWTVVSRVAPAYGTVVKDTVADAGQSVASVSDIYGDKPIGVTPTPVPKSESLSKVTGYAAKFDRQEMLVKTAVGLDFAGVSIWGQAFRVIQYVTQFLVLLGFLWLFTNRKRKGLSTEFVAGMWCSLILLAMVVFVPQFSMIINATRFYHLALFFAAPALLLGLGWVTRNNRFAPAIMLSVYFIFTSGIVYEAAKVEALDKIEVPYSIALSAGRTGVVGTFTGDDVKAAEWLAYESDPSAMIVGDYNGWHLVSAYIGLTRMREEKVSYNPTLESLPNKPAYIFLTTWNNEHGRYVESIRGIWGGAGLRESVELPDFGKYPEVYRSGQSVVYYKGENQ